ncbi:MAG: phenylalanine--tRNA ligase subunit beta [Ruminococcaceae bacterium]|nr:phenylalanine--tRNA ligase subunit beta [Oscillospiraceae bacterium]
MFISYNWIQDFVDLSGIDPDELIHRFSLSTAEVENEIFYKGRDLSGVVVAEILSVENHPESKKLHLLKVDAGDGKTTDVVCGAPNVRVGMKTAFAKVGARLGELEITPRALAGYTSFGMCCSEKEIGMSDDNGGIMELDPALVNGTDIKDVFAIDDIVFEVDNKSLTNRPDLWGHYGIAREFAALAGRELKPLDVADLTAYESLPEVDLKIENPLCYRYSCLRFENISRHVSPANMRIRLFYCGMRAINFLADLTNYLMLEMGQPMHAFDSRRVEKIRVKTFAQGFDFQTLDGVERKIDENTLMICNGDTPVAIAGIMGGLASEIVEDTTSLTLESATFDAVSVRKSSARLSHRTDASQRYEKSLDPEMTVTAIARFVRLLSEFDNGVKVTSRLTDEYARKYDSVVLDFDKRFVDRYTGIEIGNDTIVKTLTALGFGVELENDHFTVKVPSWRATKDVTLKADIIEEITRIYGYDNFDIHTAVAPLYPVRPFEEKSVEEQVKDILVKSFGLHEVHSYIWEYTDEYKKLGIETEPNVKLLNASNPNIETIRRSMIPNQLCQVKINTSYAPSFGIFEIGRVVNGLDEQGLCREEKKLAVTLFSKTETAEELYFKLLHMLATVTDDIKHKSLTYRAKEATLNYIHPRNYNAVLCNGVEIGGIGILHPTVSKKMDKKGTTVFAEIDMSAFVALTDAGIHYCETCKYPCIEVDVTYVSPKFESIRRAIEAVGSELIRKTSVVDTYTDENGKAITVRLVFVHPDRTLVKEEVMETVDRITELLKKENIFMKA